MWAAKKQIAQVAGGPAGVFPDESPLETGLQNGQHSTTRFPGNCTTPGV
jgi:hypothetical protein